MKSDFMDIGAWIDFLFIIILPVHFKSRRQKRRIDFKSLFSLFYDKIDSHDRRKECIRNPKSDR